MVTVAIAMIAVAVTMIAVTIAVVAIPLRSYANTGSCGRRRGRKRRLGASESGYRRGGCVRYRSIRRNGGSQQFKLLETAGVSSEQSQQISPCILGAWFFCSPFCCAMKLARELLV
jgi:hypothetical protein